MTEAASQTMRQTVLSVFLCLPSLLAFSTPDLNFTTEEPFSQATTLIGPVLTTGAKTEWPDPPRTSTNSYPSDESVEQRNPNVAERTVATPSGYSVSEQSGVTRTVETRGRMAESKHRKGHAETLYMTFGWGTTTGYNLDTTSTGGRQQTHEATTEKSQTAFLWWDGAETSSSRLDPRGTADPSSAPDTSEDSSHSASTSVTNYSSKPEDHTTVPASHGVAGLHTGSSTERHGGTYAQTHASANTRNTATLYDTASKAYDREIRQATETDNKTDLCNQEGSNTTTGASQLECGKREVKPVPLSKSTKLVCFVTLWTLGVTASVFFGLTVFLWVRLSVQREKDRRRRKRWTEATSERGALWTQPRGTLEERLEFWYANGPSVAPGQTQSRPQPPEDVQRRTDTETLWVQPRVTLEDITEFWYANGRTGRDMKTSEV